MTIVDYLDAIKDRLTTDPVVTSFSILRERTTLVDGHLRARLAIPTGVYSSSPSTRNDLPMDRSTSSPTVTIGPEPAET
jgi:hypothetical protein